MKFINYLFCFIMVSFLILIGILNFYLIKTTILLIIASIMIIGCIIFCIDYTRLNGFQGMNKKKKKLYRYLLIALIPLGIFVVAFNIPIDYLINGGIVPNIRPYDPVSDLLHGIFLLIVFVLIYIGIWFITKFVNKYRQRHPFIINLLNIIIIFISTIVFSYIFGSIGLIFRSLVELLENDILYLLKDFLSIVIYFIFTISTLLIHPNIMYKSIFNNDEINEMKDK